MTEMEKGALAVYVLISILYGFIHLCLMDEASQKNWDNRADHGAGYGNEYVPPITVLHIIFLPSLLIAIPAQLL